MRSIRTQITSLTILAILISVLSIGGISILSIKSVGDDDAAEKMRLICENRRKSMDEYLDGIEQAVNMISRFAGEDLNTVELVSGGVVGASGDGALLNRERDPERQRALDDYLRGHLEKVEPVFRSVSNHTNGVIAFYYRFNPELSDDVKGFLYSKIGSTGFTVVEPTEINYFSRDDISHVGWYYIPLQRGRPSWLDPYYNDNLGIEMVSFVTPVYRSGTFIGVIGMDISYRTLVEQIESIRVYNTGYACLTDEEGIILYHPALESGVPLSDVAAEFRDVETVLYNQESSQSPIRYTFQGTDKQMYFDTLTNGMKLLVIAPVSEINASWVRLIYMVLSAAAMILAVFAAVTFYTARRLTEPLQRLTEAAKHLAAGNYEIELSAGGDDEVGILTTTFQHLVNHLRIYISDLNSRAYQDAMTGVKNKGAYAITAEKLNDAIRTADEDGQPRFAIAMLDCNNLKQINDQYGHEKGDVYLQTACRLICQIFTHSPVFRMGGDEFVVILQHDDYEAREELERAFDRHAEALNAAAKEPWERVCIARGVAAYDPLTDANVENVFHRADELMYINKKRYKEAAGYGIRLSFPS